MLLIYYENNSSSSKTAINWMNDMQIKYVSKRIRYISYNDLLLVLSLSKNGFEDVLKTFTKMNPNSQRKIIKMDDMSFKESIYFLMENTELLKTPIIIDSSKLLIGFNSDEIRKFITQNYRRLQRTG